MPHTLLLAEPRGFCAGVVRAIDVLDHVLDTEPAPIYAFHEIVHNRYVVERFRQRGAIFVDEIAEVPEGARIVFSAHGVSPAVVDEARARQLRIIDATCPLVTKVHLETRKAARDGFDILLVGHRGHDEVQGTLGEAPDRTTVVDTVADLDARAKTGRPVFVVTQTTLSVDDTAEGIDGVRARHAGTATAPLSVSVAVSASRSPSSGPLRREHTGGAAARTASSSASAAAARTSSSS